ncbi:MAG: hypothetical protein KZQ96_13600 [Candidatus Thiodiazotropha sp. (ex Lucinoma borealis)]|nr:hypothetical protein [Candidatus Thiodiazotropha sp. (ex Lucinoma borealis)]
MFRRMELKQFLQAASKRERAEVARVCNDSVSYLYQLAGKHRYASALLATRIEKMTRRVAMGTKGRLKVVLRDSLVRYPEIFVGVGEEAAEYDASESGKE